MSEKRRGFVAPPRAFPLSVWATFTREFHTVTQKCTHLSNYYLTFSDLSNISLHQRLRVCDCGQTTDRRKRGVASGEVLVSQQLCGKWGHRGNLPWLLGCQAKTRTRMKTLPPRSCILADHKFIPNRRYISCVFFSIWKVQACPLTVTVLGRQKKFHCKRVSLYTMIFSIKRFFSRQKNCHCIRSVTVSGQACIYSSSSGYPALLTKTDITI